MGPTSVRTLGRGVVVALAWACPAWSQPVAPEVRVSIVYTGRSLGALGVLQDPDEHELLVEEAKRAGTPLRLATYRCWRAPGLVVFSPEADLDGGALASLRELEEKLLAFEHVLEPETPPAAAGRGRRRAARK